jgi:hypothetical protein
LAEHLLGGRQFLPFAFRPQLGHHRLGTMGIGRYQVHSGHLISMNASQTLPIQSQGVGGCHTGLDQPPSHGSLEGRYV